MREHVGQVSRLVIGAVAAVALVLGPSAVVGGIDDARPQAQPCYNGVLPLAPDLQSCSLPSKQPRVAGAAPDAGAIIACRHHPGCLAWYVNTPH